METKNKIISSYIASLKNMVNLMESNSLLFNDNSVENQAIVATLNINIQSVKSQLTLLQNVLDTYNEV